MALNELTQHYQGSSTSITIELSSPWQEAQLFGGNDKGILGGVVLTTLSNTRSFEDHPFINALNTMNIRVGSNFSDGKSYRGIFTLYHLPSIEQIPEKCQKCINQDLKQQDHQSNQNGLKF